MKIFYTDHFVLPLPSDHRFPMEKYSLLRKRVVSAGLAGEHELEVPEPVTDEQLFRAHDRAYVER
ncbi:MAG: histone deacetylase, partial [Gemmatimonadota bacterium]